MDWSLVESWREVNVRFGRRKLILQSFSNGSHYEAEASKMSVSTYGVPELLEKEAS